MNRKSPNVVFVLTDDQGYPPMGAHGDPVIQTPNLDAFHGESARFEQFHCGTTCAPTRAGLLTGMHSNSTGVWHTIGGRSLLRRDEWTLPQALREQGYRTGLFGKWHLGDAYPYRPQDRGFDETVCHGGGGISQQPDWWGNDYFDDTYMVNGEPRSFTGYCTDVFFNEAQDFIRKNRDKPFFCFISTNAPHSPFNVPTRYRDRYRDAVGSENYARFLGMVTNIDENFGRLRETLRELNLEDDTVLVFMSDNGQTACDDPTVEMFNAGMRGIKGSPYEGGHRVPCLVRWPNGGLSAPRAIPELAGYVDFMPTMLELCGVPVPAQRQFHGRSLAPLLRGESVPEWRERVLVVDTQRVPHPIPWRLSCVMQDHWRLVNRDELYHLAEDPAQTTNVIDAHPDVAAELRAAYEDWWTLCSERMAEDIPVSIGAAAEEVSVLRSHDLRNETELGFVWNQGQVRAGKTCGGCWEIFAETDGLYEFALRRWPKEAGHRITEGIEVDDVVWSVDGIQPGAEYYYQGGKALAVDTACMEITGRAQQYQTLADGAEAAVFRVALRRGGYRMRGRFSAAADGFQTSAYYVEVRCLGAVDVGDG